MNTLKIHQTSRLRGVIAVPGDKSISHRALMLGALAEGKSHIRNFLPSGDCLATLNVLRALGVEIERRDETTLTICGSGLQKPEKPLNCARSGTTMRLLAGILAGQPFGCTLTGDPQLLGRPMRRITGPLRQMGAQIDDQQGYAPLTIHSAPLHGGVHTLDVASAQVKSALLLAGLYADGPTTVRQCGPARDHTERMLQSQIANPRSSPTRRPPEHALTVDGLTITLTPSLIDHLEPLDLDIPGDFSSAAFLLVAGLLAPNSNVTITDVGVNPTRTGLLDVLRAMGAGITLSNKREQGNEPVADVTVRTSPLKGAEIGAAMIVRGAMVVRMIDEFPILAVAATQAQGRTIVRDARELRVKETDRIATVVDELRKLGADIEPQADGFVVHGPTPLQGAVVDSHGDHRLAMALAVAGLIAAGETVVQNTDCIDDSFPGFEYVIRNVMSVG